ncbi:hypothetical protein TI03_07375 [Achromatium sp. WMS1]|nr:hypothetical protein TI03_07375 [Achromatium sp. WMS1]
MAKYGLHLGIAFQLVDDILDYNPNNPELGKNVGDDLAEGKPTLPLIRAMEIGDNAQKAVIRAAIEHGDRNQLEAVLAAIATTDAIEYAKDIAKQEVKLAQLSLQQMPSSPYVEALFTLADFAISRTY